MSSETIFRTSLLEENDGTGQNPTDNRTMGEIIASRFSRRGFLKGSLAVSAIAATVSPMALMLADEARAASGSAFTFDEVEAGVDETHHVAAGYDADVLLRWGDPIFADAPAFDHGQTMIMLDHFLRYAVDLRFESVESPCVIVMLLRMRGEHL